MRLAVAPVADQPAPGWLDLGPEHDFYLANAGWLPGGARVWYLWQSRNQKHLELRLIDVDVGALADGRADQACGPALTVVSESCLPSWVNLPGPNDLKWLKHSVGQFVLSSERSGFKHLYLGEADKPDQLRPITQGDWQVDALEFVDEQAGQAGRWLRLAVREGQVYFSGRKSSVLERQLYSAPLAALAEPTQISQAAGVHVVVCGLPARQLSLWCVAVVC